MSSSVTAKRSDRPRGHDAVANRDAQRRGVLVAISGGSGAGKTTLAEALVSHYGSACGLLPMDSYYRHFDMLTVDERESLDWESVDTLDVTLLTQHLMALERGHTIDVPEFNFEVRLRSSAISRFAAPRILILEGLFALAIDHVTTSADLRIFLDATEPVRYQRRHDRDVATRGRTSASVHDQWANSVIPGHHSVVEPQRRNANLVLDGDRPMHDSLGRAAQYINALLMASPPGAAS